MTQGWEGQAENWLAWARTPGHDAYWHYSPTFMALLPSPGESTLEIGCGEGRVARDLAARGHRVVGVDASPTLIDAARAADPASRYVLADAVVLPFADRSFDLAVAYNALMDIEDMPGAVREVGRVLRPGGHFCICVTHPTADAGRFAGDEPDAPFVITGSYFGRRRLEVVSERDGLRMEFGSWAYPLEAYMRAIETAGMLVQALREPAAPRSADRPAYARWRRLPMFLMVRAMRP